MGPNGCSHVGPHRDADQEIVVDYKSLGGDKSCSNYWELRIGVALHLSIHLPGV